MEKVTARRKVPYSYEPVARVSRLFFERLAGFAWGFAASRPAMALSKAVKIVRGLRQGLTREEREAVADDFWPAQIYFKFPVRKFILKFARTPAQILWKIPRRAPLSVARSARRQRVNEALISSPKLRRVTCQELSRPNCFAGQRASHVRASI
jgi:hypothetical protein